MWQLGTLEQPQQEGVCHKPGVEHDPSKRWGTDSCQSLVAASAAEHLSSSTHCAYSVLSMQNLTRSTCEQQCASVTCSACQKPSRWALHLKVSH